MKKLIKAFVPFTVQNVLPYMSFAYALVFSISFAFNQGYFFSTDLSIEVVHLIDSDTETEEENTEDDKTLSDLFFARNKSSNEHINGILSRVHINHSLIAVFLEIILPPPWILDEFI